MIVRASLAIAAALLALSPAHAQERGDGARLDDFAVPGAARAAAVDQVGPRRDDAPEAQMRDRGLVIPAPATLRDAEARALPQVTAPDRARPVAQLAAPGERSAAGAPALSARSDSRPEAVGRLAGSDRCDRQSREAGESERCRQILERRAAEFAATRPPELSAEERLLAEQQRRDSGVLSPTRASDSGRIGGMNAADDRANQELAAIVLGTARAPSPTPSPPEPTSDAATLSEVLEGLIVQVGANP